MKLYTLTKKRKRVRPLDLTTGYIDYQNTFYLEPEEPTEVPDKVAKILIEQNPHIISTKPRSKVVPPDDAKDVGGVKMVTHKCPKCGNTYATEAKRGLSPMACPFCLIPANSTQGLTEGSAEPKPEPIKTEEPKPVNPAGPTDAQMKIIREIAAANDDGTLESWELKKVRDYAKKLDNKILANIAGEKQRAQLLDIAISLLPQE